MWSLLKEIHLRGSPLTRNNNVLAAGFRSKTRAPKPDPPLYTNSRRKRMPLTTKMANKNFYKGNGCRKEGSLNSRGRFIMDREMCTTLIVPDLTDFNLKAYVANGIKKHVREVNPDVEDAVSV